MRRRTPYRQHLLMLLAAIALVPATALARHQADEAGTHEVAVALRLADGSFIRVACDRTAPRGNCPRASSFESASDPAGPRRAPLKRRTQAPGVVAGVRG